MSLTDSDSFFPILENIKEADYSSLGSDLQIGLTLAFLAIPQCMAYATIAELHPIYGLYAGIVTSIIAGFLMSSRHAITGPTATVSLIVGGILIGVDATNTTAVIYLAIMVGLFQILFYLTNLGALARFVSDAVISGFVMGSACVIIGGQILSLLGSPRIKSSYFIVRLFYSLQSLYADISLINIPAITVGLLTVIVLGFLRWRFYNFPSSLLVLLIGAGCSWYFQFEQLGLETVGTIPSLIPTLTLPSVSNAHLIENLLSGALALSIFSSIQCISVVKSIAGKSGDIVDKNRELLGQGSANIVTGILSGYPVGASFSRSFLNHSMGATTQLSAVASGIFVALLTAVGTPVIYFIPLPVLAGIIIVVVAEVINFEEAMMVWSTTLQDRISFIGTFLGVLFLRLDLAIYLGVVVSLIFYLKEATRLDLKEYIINEDGTLKYITDLEDRIDPRIVLIDVNGEAFFGSADQIRKRVKGLCVQSEKLKVIILRMKNVTNFDITGASVLRSIANELKERNKTLMLCGTTPDIRDVLEQSEVNQVIGEDKILVAQKNLLESTKMAFQRGREYIDEVINEGVHPEEEDPPLDYTMEELEEDPEADEKQDPIEQEKHTVDEQDEIDSE
ncbi:MAG: SulP family inorganic anion transporter [bacterium]